MNQGISIGDFSRITHLSIQTLRRYHDEALLVPDRVDQWTNYRYYGLQQIPTAQVIRRFRDLDMPLSEIRAVLAVSDPSERASLVAQHLKRLETQLDQTRAAIASLHRLLQPEPTALEVHLIRTQPIEAAAIRGLVDRQDILDWYSEAMSEIDGALAASDGAATGPPGGLYADELFTADQGAATVYVPAERPPTKGRVIALVIPAAELATTVHMGPHDDIDMTYAALGTYVREQSMDVAGLVRETYHVGPNDTLDSSKWRTEIGWPIFRTTAASPSVSGTVQATE